ncbi:MAG TPA: hypothetical protein VFC63_08025, partial [Blastocatellia bacterium]|nr:hypothetical protein [Blastocatellia bacterium]
DLKEKDKEVAMKTEKKLSPIACNIKALTSDQRNHLREIGGHLRTEVKDVHDLPFGFAYRFEPANLVEVAEFVSMERLCCPFIDFEVEVESEGGPLWLRATGRDGVKVYLKEELRYLFPK